MPGDNAAVTVSLDKAVALDIGSHFAIREGGKTVGSGVITEVVEQTPWGWSDPSPFLTPRFPCLLIKHKLLRVNERPQQVLVRQFLVGRVALNVLQGDAQVL